MIPVLCNVQRVLWQKGNEMPPSRLADIHRCAITTLCLFLYSMKFREVGKNYITPNQEARVPYRILHHLLFWSCVVVVCCEL